MKILVYDITITGHHSEYIGHLVNHISKNPSRNIYYFIVHPEFSSRFQGITSKAIGTENIQWIEITRNELSRTLIGGKIRRSFSNFKLLNFYSDRYSIDHVILLYFNTFQLALALKRFKYTIDGILFRQFYRMKVSSLKERLVYKRKYFITKLLLRNNKIKNVYILNDHYTVESFNKAFNTDVFKLLHDPVPILPQKSNFSIVDYHHIENNRKIFLHIGSLSDRKGTLEILDSLYHLDDNILKVITLLLIGKADTSIDYHIKNRLKELNMKKPFSSIIFRNEYVSESEMKSYLEQSDYLLIPYKNIESSSGILGHAISTGKPVLSTKNGVIADLVTKYNAGILIDEVSPSSIGFGINKLLSTDIKIYNREEFKTIHSHINFSKKLIGKS